MSANPVPVQTPDPAPQPVTAPTGPAGNEPSQREQHSWWSDLLEQNYAFSVTWAISAGLGAFAISASKGVAMPRLGIPIFLMLTYAFLGYQRATLASTPMIRAARLGQLADSLYFLGFLWTLWALIDSFVIKQMSASEAVFRTFGYALVTTAVGMFFRLLLVQFMYSSADQDELAGHELEKQMGRFSDAVSKSVLAINILKKGVEDADAENRRNLGQLAKNAESLLKEFADSTSTLLKPSLTMLSGAIKNCASTIKDAHTRLENTSVTFDTSLKKNVADFEKSVDDVRNSLTVAKINMVEAVNSATTSIGVQTTNFGRAVSGSTNNLAAKWQTCKEIMLKAAEDMRLSAASLTIQVGSAGKAVEDVEGSIRSVAKRIDSIRVSPDIVEVSVDRKVSSALVGLQKAVKTLNDATENLMTATAKVQAHGESKSFLPAVADRIRSIFGR